MSPAKCAVTSVIAATLLVTQAATAADPTIEATPVAPPGKCVGLTLSPHGQHTAALATKGSRFVVIVDGVEGPKIDKMLALNGEPYLSSTSGQPREIPVLFSDDSAHWVYGAQVGDEYVLTLDGKEFSRGKYVSSFMSNGPLTFTAGGKHLYYVEADPAGGYHVVMDGQPGPKSHTPPKVVSSPDGAHYAYVGTQADGNDTPWGLVDGKQVKYFGDDLRFTGKGHLVALLKGKGEMALNIDGKNAVVANNITQLQISKTGGEIAAMVYVAKTNKTFLTINGKAIPGTEGALLQTVYFSPDDKRYAAVCASTTTPGAFVILDGKKGQKYDAITAGQDAGTNARTFANSRAIGDQTLIDAANAPVPGFTGDSSKFFYVAQSAGKYFLVADDDESDAAQTIATAFSPDGKHYGYVAVNGANPPQLFIDGKQVTLKGRAGAPNLSGNILTFSPDSAHYIFNSRGSVFLDGVEVPDVVCAGQYIFSPDGKHVLLVGSSASNPNVSGIYLDGKLVVPSPAGTTILRPTFSPDSAHVYWIGNRPSATSDDHDNALLWVDGKPTPVFFRAFANQAPGNTGNFETSPDGTLTFVAQTADEIKRYKVTPAADSGITKMLAEAETKKPAAGRR